MERAEYPAMLVSNAAYVVGRNRRNNADILRNSLSWHLVRQSMFSMIAYGRSESSILPLRTGFK